MRTVAAAIIAHTAGATQIDDNDRIVHPTEATDWVVTLDDDGD